MDNDALRKTGFICGIICIIAGLATLVLGLFFIQGNSFLGFSGVIFTALGAVFIGLNLPKKKQ